jgi:hypothetical protein
VVEYAAVLSRKSKYGLKALLMLAEDADRGPVLVSELAERDAIPKKFLEAILLELGNRPRSRSARSSARSTVRSRPSRASAKRPIWNARNA